MLAHTPIVCLIYRLELLPPIVFEKRANFCLQAPSLSAPLDTRQSSSPTCWPTNMYKGRTPKNKGDWRFYRDRCIARKREQAGFSSASGSSPVTWKCYDPEESNVKLSPQQLYVLQLVREGKSVFYTGNAGTGKTTLLKEIVKCSPDSEAFVTALVNIWLQYIFVCGLCARVYLGFVCVWGGEGGRVVGGWPGRGEKQGKLTLPLFLGAIPQGHCVPIFLTGGPNAV